MKLGSTAPLLVLLLVACATSGSQRPPAQPASPALPPTSTANTQASSSAPVPTAFDPVGMYDFTTQVNGEAVAGTLQISRNSAGGYGGSLNAAGMPPATIQSVTVSGQTMTLVADVGGQSVTMNLTMSGNTFSGSWTGAGGAGDVKGTKRTS